MSMQSGGLAGDPSRPLPPPSPPPSGHGEDPTQPGRAARELVRRARQLHRSTGNLLARHELLRRGVRDRLETVRTDLVQRQLATLPVERLRDSTGGRLRLGLLGKGGYSTVAQVAAARSTDLLQIPGVGQQTATQAVAAARRLEAAMRDNMAVRLDPDRRGKDQQRLLVALWVYDRADNAFASLLSRADAYRALADPLIKPSARAASRWRLRLTLRRTRREEALAALEDIHVLLDEPEVTELARDLPAALRWPLPRAPKPDDLWRDYERRAAEYNRLLGEIAGLDVDVDAAQGFVPAEIAARVDEQQLDDTFLDVSLRGYQAFGAKFALVQRRSILGDEMGLGKTIEAIAAMAHLRSTGATHFMVVCPASVLVNWTREIAQRSRLRACRVHGSDRPAIHPWAEQGGVAVTTFETLRTLAPPLEVPLAMLVVDEAHYVKNPDALRSKAVRRWIQPAERALFLTGTPMENRVDEFRTLVRYLQPGVAARLGDHDGLAGAQAFRKVVAPAYLRRNQDDVLQELPDKLEVDDWVDLTPADMVAYREAVASGNFMAMRRAAFAAAAHEGSGKLERLLEIVEESAANGWKVVVYSFFRDVLATIERALGARAVGPLTGSTPPAARQELVDAFTAIDGHAVLVSQIQVGGVGLNLQAASVVILAEPQWKPSSEDQAIARCHRMGQVRRVHVHRLLADDSVDRRMLEILERKATLFDEYVRKSDLKDASPDTIDISDVDAARQIVNEAEAERQIVALEQERLGLTPSADNR